jgi:hypothetical protein
MFQRARDRIVLWPVRFAVATDDGVVTAELSARLRLWTTTRVEEDAIEQAQTQAALIHSLLGQSPNKTAEDVTSRADQAVEVGLAARARLGRLREELMEAVVGWEDVLDEHGAPLAYSRAELASLLDQYPNALEGFVEALRSASKPSGALAKN